ncbi:MAG TPA: type II toxin-antitoxin system VapC family toxin [Solirubrobacterales bacterium]|nr:type II toxin-antitoxin system VapC family toxin [Solirubrobacterales bacterium]
MSTLLLDASVWIGAADAGDPFHESAKVLVFDFDRPVAAMDLTLYEVANALGVRKGHPREARYMAELIVKRCSGESLVAADPDLMGMATSVAGEHGLTAYDASYVAAATSNGWTLVSADIADLVSKGLAVTPDDADYS